MFVMENFNGAHFLVAVGASELSARYSGHLFLLIDNKFAATMKYYKLGMNRVDKYKYIVKICIEL